MLIKKSLGLWLVIFLFTLCYMGATGQTTWTVAYNKPNVKVETKYYKNTKIKTFRLTAMVTYHTMDEFYNLLLDVNKMGDWYDRINRVDVLKETSNTDAVYAIIYDIPFPFEDRMCTVKATIEYNKSTQKIYVKTNHINYPLSKIEAKKYASMSRVEALDSYWSISKNTNGTISLIHEGYMNPGGNITASMVNMGIEYGPVKTLESMLKILPKYK